MRRAKRFYTNHIIYFIMDEYKAVFHLDEGIKAKADLTLKNMENLVAELGQGNVEVELVVNYEAVILFLRSPNLYGDRVKELSAKGVRFLVCAKAMRMLNVEKEMLLEQFEIIPAAIVELVKKQAQGWAYIKP